MEAKRKLSHSLNIEFHTNCVRGICLILFLLLQIQLAWTSVCFSVCASVAPSACLSLHASKSLCGSYCPRVRPSACMCGEKNLFWLSSLGNFLFTWPHKIVGINFTALPKEFNRYRLKVLGVGTLSSFLRSLSSCMWIIC